MKRVLVYSTVNSERFRKGDVRKMHPRLAELLEKQGKVSSKPVTGELKDLEEPVKKEDTEKKSAPKKTEEPLPPDIEAALGDLN